MIKILKQYRISKYIYMISLLVLLILSPQFKSTLDLQLLSTYNLLFLFVTFIHFLTQKDKNWFRLDTLFILGFGIVHFQWSIMLSFSGIEPVHFSRLFSNSLYINYGTWLSTIGIIMFYLGYDFLPHKKNKTISYNLDNNKLFLFTLITFIVFILTAGSAFLSGNIYKGFGGQTAGEGISAYFQLLSGISILLLISLSFLNVEKIRNRTSILSIAKIDKKTVSLVTLYVLLFLSIGDRGEAVMVIFTVLILYGSLIRPISFKYFIIMTIVGAIFLTIIGLGRSSTSDNVLIAGTQKLELNSYYDMTEELAGSARTLYLAVSYVPQYEDYFYGKLWLANFLSIFPLSQNIYLQLSNDKIYNLASTKYITYLRSGENATTGAGTSLIADIYLNFGLYGVVFFMFFLGIFLKNLQNKMNTKESIYWILIAGLCASSAFAMGRVSLFDPARIVVWGLIIFIFLVKTKRIVK